MIEQGKRLSGRTARMLEGLGPDVRILTGPVPPHHFKAEAQRAGHRDTKVFAGDPRKPAYDHGQPIMREGTYPTLFDHTWVTARLRVLIDDAIGRVAHEMDQVTCRPFAPLRRRMDRG